jgi:deoxyribodipyrimidine photo-lyase
MPNGAIIVWFRLDLRLADNPALCDAAATGRPIIPAFIWCPEEEGAWLPGAATKWWLHQSLCSLRNNLEKKGARLVIRRGPAVFALRKLIKETGASAVHWNRRYEPTLQDRDAKIEKVLTAEGILVRTSNSALLFEPWEIATKQGTPFRVFTPFWKACQTSNSPPEPLPEPKALVPPDAWPQSLDIENLGLEPTADWTGGLRKAWQPGEGGAWERLKSFVEGPIDDYDDQRDMPAVEGTARLSPHLHFGEIGPRQVWHNVEAQAAACADRTQGHEAFLRQLFWREFAHHVLYHQPHTTDAPLRPAFAVFPWADDDEALCAWQQGRTGYPLVDAGMRELWATGWMHNRVRLSAASFLVKHLLIPWQEGARWFWDTLVDADLANNTLGWQWTAGCGADAAPYFRIFNPVRQGERFDPQGAYVRRWVPEVAKLANNFVHCPWQAPIDALKEAGIVLGDTYPRPIIDHAQARARALHAYDEVKGG